jgi:hypothetical protein
MILTTPAPESSTRCSCPNPHCPWFNRPGEGHSAHRSWTGTHPHLDRLRCTACGRACSEREGTGLARRKLPEDTVVRRLKGQRWGVWDAGTADIGAGARKTVHRLQPVAAQRAEPPHRQVGREVDVPGVQWDAAHATLRPPQGAWLHTAVAMGRWGLLGVDVGPRPQEPAAALVAQGVARVREVPSFLPDGWNAARAALLQVVGVVDRRRRRGTVGRTPTPRLVAPNNLGDAQVVKVRNQAGQVGAGRRRVVCGGPRRCGPPWRLRARGPTLQTAFMERWDGTLRGLVAPLRRRPRCLSWSRPRHRGRRWLMVSLSNCVRPHKSLRQGRTPRTPAMAIGLTEHVWSSREYSWLQVHTAPVLTQHMDAQMARLLPPALQDQPRGRPQPPPPVEATAGHKKATAPLPKAA